MPRSFLRDLEPRKRGYYGLYYRMIVWDQEHDKHKIPTWLWIVYWKLQPIRCILTFHNWYSEAAGLCAACRCGASEAYSTQLMHEYRWRPNTRKLVRALEEAEYSRDVGWESYHDAVKSFVAHIDKYHNGIYDEIYPVED